MQEVMLGKITPDSNWLETNLRNTCDPPENILMECVKL